MDVLKNDLVIDAWAQGRDARNHKGTLVSMDGSLYSYQLKIAQRTPSGTCVVANYTAGGEYHSQTTSCHVGRARRFADMVMHPRVWETSPLSCDPTYEQLPF
jgi:hypothetical protein